MRLNDYRAIVFDLDDTLYLERDYVQSGFRAVADFVNQHYGWSATHADRLFATCQDLFFTGNRGDIFNTALATLGHAARPPAVAELVDVYRQHRPRIELQPDARALLDQLQGHANLWVITDGPLVSQRAKARALQLSRHVSSIVFTDRWGREFWKPHPRAFRHVQRTAGVPPRQCIYLADNPGKDFIAPRKLGWTTLRIRRLEGLHAQREAAPEGQPDRELPSLWPLVHHVRSAADSQAA